MSIRVTLWSKPLCVQCKMSERALDAAGVMYEEFDLTAPEHARDLARLKSLGYLQAPIMEVEGFTVLDTASGEPIEVSDWSGFRRDLIDQIPGPIAVEAAVVA